MQTITKQLICNEINLFVYSQSLNYSYSEELGSSETSELLGSSIVLTGDSTVLSGDSTVLTGDSTVLTGDSTVLTGDSTVLTGDSMELSGDSSGLSPFLTLDRLSPTLNSLNLKLLPVLIRKTLTTICLCHDHV